jgi:exoribonuclease R
MREITLNRRKWRLDGGALLIEKKKKKYILDELNNPLGFQIEERNEA